MKKRKFKGMTLIEIIVSLAVLAVMTLILVQTSNTINLYIRSANKVNQKTTQQAPVAEMGYKNAGNLVQEDVKINVNGPYGIDQDLQGDAYEVIDSVPADASGVGADLRMQFITDLEAAPEAP